MLLMINMVSLVYRAMLHKAFLLVPWLEIQQFLILTVYLLLGIKLICHILHVGILLIIPQQHNTLIFIRVICVYLHIRQMEQVYWYILQWMLFIKGLFLSPITI